MANAARSTQGTRLKVIFEGGIVLDDTMILNIGRQAAVDRSTGLESLK